MSKNDIIHNFETGDFKFSIEKGLGPKYFDLLKNGQYLCSIFGFPNTALGSKELEFVESFVPENAVDRAAIKGAIKYLKKRFEAQ